MQRRKNSILRVDRCTESTASSSTSASSSWSNSYLEGVTIGSDHNFNMTLCFGNDKDQEEYGCDDISEIVTFKVLLSMKTS